MGQIRLNLENEMHGHDWIWRLDGGVHHRLLRPASGEGKNCREIKVYQMPRSRYQTKAGVMYITPVPTKSTLDSYWERNQRLNFMEFNWNLLDFENSKLKKIASMKRTSYNTATTRNKQYITGFEENKNWSKPLICRVWEHNSLLWMLAVCSLDQSEEG